MTNVMHSLVENPARILYFIGSYTGQVGSCIGSISRDSWWDPELQFYRNESLMSEN